MPAWISPSTTTSASQRLFPVSSSASASVGWRPCQPLAWLPSTSAWHFSTSASCSPKNTSLSPGPLLSRRKPFTDGLAAFPVDCARRQV
ncbi:uncharacterized protein SCHCODRAFT_02220018 [Schizophyllum commune H4-8]|uniref:uncharacterized protein n=1 Tax=Schizophyllum commune (strain H4-8 / FGSC 9210) TaxID=578458 RepID=UPI00215E8079|nr:uncharacterized protein SCHCODRAFT_02220018 [Schizophyllum commune H4-8]KAI5894943.1 hypothetical protein SCHCODRAFT_02220018 [Schizophyllum commune H4-8]